MSGRPDLVFPSRMKVIFIHGCFWHRHGKRCVKTTMPKTRVAFWVDKFESFGRLGMPNEKPRPHHIKDYALFRRVIEVRGTLDFASVGTKLTRST